MLRKLSRSHRACPVECHKENEFVFARTDIVATVLFRKSDKLETISDIVLVKEFRTPSRTDDGFIYEIPGGSLEVDKGAKGTAEMEILEEIGLQIDQNRLKYIGSRQVAGTLSSHKAIVFSYLLTDMEWEKLMKLKKNTMGKVEDTERTYIQIRKLDDILQGDVECDWSNVGMIMSALLRN